MRFREVNIISSEILEEVREELLELGIEELASDEALLGRCFPDVFDGSLESGVYQGKKEEYGRVIKEVVEKLLSI